MKISLLLSSISLVGAFHVGSVSRTTTTATLSSAAPSSSTELAPSLHEENLPETRKAFLVKSFSGVAAVSSSCFLLGPEPAVARGRATLEKSYERYAPRIIAGGEFYGGDLRQLVSKNDWAGIKNALQEPPDRKKEDLAKPDAGVAERARQAGQFSDARVLTAADLFAGAFSDNSISPKTKKMKAAVEKVRVAVSGMQSLARQALGEESAGGGLFGFGAKKPSEAELAKKLREYYVAGGNAWNEYVFAANNDLALQFDRFPFIKG